MLLCSQLFPYLSGIAMRQCCLWLCSGRLWVAFRPNPGRRRRRRRQLAGVSGGSAGLIAATHQPHGNTLSQPPTAIYLFTYLFIKAEQSNAVNTNTIVITRCRQSRTLARLAAPLATPVSSVQKTDENWLPWQRPVRHRNNFIIYRLQS